MGAGNALIIVDETADLKDAADKIMRSKTFDTSCSTENALAIQESIYAQMLKELDAAGAYLCSAEEKAKLAKGMWDEKGALNREIVAQPAEKLSVTMTLYKDKEFSEAIEPVKRITAHSGPGHSCGIHTANELRIRELSHKVKVSRIMVRQPQHPALGRGAVRQHHV